MESLELDRIDRRMLAVLREDGRIPNSAPPRRPVRVSNSASPSAPRGQRPHRWLRAAGESGPAGKPDHFLEIALTAQEEAALSAFEAAVQDRPEILECYLMSGEYDYLLRGGGGLCGL